MADSASSGTLSDPTAFQRAREIIDEAHREDPNGQELIYADNVEKFLRVLVAPAEPTNVQVIAARCQHLRRFLTPRSSYPAGKAGYLKWRRDLYTIQADHASTLLAPLSLPESEIKEIRDAIAKKDLLIKAKVHPTTTLLEDAAVLVFLAEEVEGFKEAHEDYTEEKWVGIVRKTWRKLSARGREEAVKLLPVMEEGFRAVVMKAVEEESAKEAGADATEGGN